MTGQYEVEASTSYVDAYNSQLRGTRGVGTWGILLLPYPALRPPSPKEHRAESLRRRGLRKGRTKRAEKMLLTGIERGGGRVCDIFWVTSAELFVFVRIGE